MFIAAIIIGLSFFGLAGRGGVVFLKWATWFIGRTVFVMPVLFALAGIMLLNTQKKHFLRSIIIILVLSILGIDGLLGAFAIFYSKETNIMGGIVGYILAWLPMIAFGIWASVVIFLAFLAASLVIAWQIRPQGEEEKGEVKAESNLALKNFLAPKFTIKELPAGKIKSLDTKGQPEVINPVPAEVKPVAVGMHGDAFGPKNGKNFSSYHLPPIDLLEPDRGGAQSGDIKVNSAIIKRTLENFDIPVEISEVNIGPAVTQYAMKPAEGIKLSKIVVLSNDLALSLAAHPIRIEAPIPGRPLVGIEVPNRVRAQVRLRNIIENPAFQTAASHLMLALGRDVAGNHVYADLERMPHLLVAGSTGTGKTIGLNSIIMSLLYQSSPDILRLILVDPKRVEFPVYNDLPHLLTPVIFDPQKTVNALKWLVGEMERRFDVLAEVKARDILGYNSVMLKENKEPMPYIVLIVDELADLMAARGRDIEAGIVRLAQMARATGIHLVVATQRPSVEVITGLIKANITSRMAFQVASQVDSRTVLDSSGAEKLLGLGDMLFISAEMSKPKRIQGSYVSDKEVKRVVKFIKEEAFNEKSEHDEYVREKIKMAEDLEHAIESGGVEGGGFFGGEGDEPLYEEAKKLVIETRKASASFLQRRLRVGYARAARLIDMMEEKGVVGPGEGAKPRDVLMDPEVSNGQRAIDNVAKEEEDDEWEKV